MKSTLDPSHKGASGKNGSYFFLSLDVVEEFAILCVFKDDEDVTGGVNKFKVLDNVWMVEAAQNLDLPLHLFEDALTLDFALVENLDGNLVLCHLILSHYTNAE